MASCLSFSARLSLFSFQRPVGKILEELSLGHVTISAQIGKKEGRGQEHP